MTDIGLKRERDRERETEMDKCLFQLLWCMKLEYIIQQVHYIVYSYKQCRDKIKFNFIGPNKN